MTISEKTAYFKGMMEGLGIDPETRDGKLWKALGDLISDMAHEIDEIRDRTDDCQDALDEVYEELVYLEDLTGGMEKIDDDDLDDYYPFGGGFSDLDDEDEEDDEEDDEDVDEDDDLTYDGIIYDVTCPNCGNEISFDEETLEVGSITCPQCGELLEFDLGSGEDE